MVISPRFFAAILFVLVPSNIGRTVSFSSQEWVLPIDDICDMFSRGVDKFYLEGATLLSSGSIYSQVKNDTMVNEIADCARKYGTSMSLLLWTDDYPYDECSPGLLNFTAFKHQLQSYITQYDVDEVTFWIGAGKCEQFHWQISSKISRIIRRSLKTRSGKPVRASLGFAAESLDSPLWNYVVEARVGRYFDTVSVHFGHPGLVDERIVDNCFVRDVVDRLLSRGIWRHQIELSVETLGYNKSSYPSLRPILYSELITKGAPPISDGHYDGCIYESQQQVVDKIRLIEEKRMHGFSLSTIAFDLPVKNRSSLLYAALYY